MSKRGDFKNATTIKEKRVFILFYILDINGVWVLTLLLYPFAPEILISS